MRSSRAVKHPPISTQGLLLLTLAYTLAVPPATVCAQTAAGWTQTFDEEFSSISLWTPANPSGRWKTWFIWGTGERTLPGNEELQCYVDPTYQSLGLNPFSINNDILTITANVVTDPAVRSRMPAYSYVGARWFADDDNHLPITSGLLTSEQSFSQLYGYFEIRCKTPAGKGHWPAFWLLPRDPQQRPVEIDALEILGHEPGLVHFGAFRREEFDEDGDGVIEPVRYGGVAFPSTFNSTEAFHVYGVDWQSDYITWYLDGRKVHQTPTHSSASTPMYMLANLAVGGKMPGFPDLSTPFPARMEIDYIRAWTRSDATAAPPTLLSYAVGTVGSPGSVSLKKTGPSTITGAGAGCPIDATADNFQYGARLLDGDGEMLVRINSTSVTAGQAGLMIRETLTPGSPYAAVFLSNGICRYQTRAVANGPASRLMQVSFVSNPRWLMLRRRGNEFTAFQSSDGISWNFAGGSRNTFPANVYVGVAVSSGSTGTLNTVTLQNLDAPVEVVADDADSSVCSRFGTWSGASHHGYHGGGCISDGNTGKGLGKYVLFTPNLAAGNYTLLLNWTAHTLRATNVPIRITHANGVTDVLVDQQRPGNWLNLGMYRFNSGTGGSVRVGTAYTGPNNATVLTNNYVIADAVRFVATAPFNSLLDNPQATTAGEWVSSKTTIGYIGLDYVTDAFDKGTEKTITYSSLLPAAGRFNILFNYPAASNRSTNVSVTVTHSGGAATQYVDQRSSGVWRPLGVFQLNATGSSVRVSNDSTAINTAVVADAVRFESVTMPLPQPPR